MPIYEYKLDDSVEDSGGQQPGCEHCRVKFEELERAGDLPLKKCPQCGSPVARVLSSFAVTGYEKNMMSKKNLEEKGFTRYEKAGDGFYEKTAGKGPDVIKR